MKRAGLIVSWLAAGAAMLAVAAPAAAATAQQAIDLLNAERVANGIPGGIVEVPEWSAKCAAHVRYMTATDTVTHAEDPTNPNYTVDGNWAGTSSVLSTGAYDTANAWDYAPLHLDQLLQPGLTETGYADDGRHMCMVTIPGVTSSWQGVYTVPGDGRQDVPFAVTTGELPTTPAVQVGLAPDAVTGPNLLVYAHSGAVASAQLVGPSGPVEVRWLDDTNPYSAYIADGAILVPVAPLEPDSTYTASVVFTGGAAKTWSFHTNLRRNLVAVAWGHTPPRLVAPTPAGVAVPITGYSGLAAVRVTATSSTGATLSATVNVTAIIPIDDIEGDPPDDWASELTLSPGTWTVCADSGGPGSGGYAAAHACSHTQLVVLPATATPLQGAAVLRDTTAPLLRLRVHSLVRRWLSSLVTASDDSGTINECRYRLNRAAWHSCTVNRHGTVTLHTHLPARGREVLTVRVSDAAGHHTTRSLLARGR